MKSGADGWRKKQIAGPEFGRIPSPWGSVYEFYWSPISTLSMEGRCEASIPGRYITCVVRRE